jgi:uncharacterized protein YndB with AHSA1/START domain
MTAAANKRPAGDTDGREIIETRVLNAPRELVWRAWTDPAHISNWWGPDGFTTTTETMDVRPGGLWLHVMHGPDGTDYPNRTEYMEVQEPARIVYRNSGSTKDRSDVSFVSHIDLIDLDGRTEIRIRLVFDSAQMRDAAAEEYGAVDGLRQMLGRLDRYLPNY